MLRVLGEKVHRVARLHEKTQQCVAMMSNQPSNVFVINGYTLDVRL